MALIQFQKGRKLQLTKNFSSLEFECPCNQCTSNYIDEELVKLLQELREKYNDSITITSGYRCPAHNAAVGGVPSSAHQAGLAADFQPKIVNVDELDKLYDLAYSIFNNIGDGRHKKFVHVDTRPKKTNGQKRVWTY